MHHIQGWAAQHGPTDINLLTPACPPDNRLIEQGWTVRKRKDGRTAWLPPPHLDTGQTRVNNYHHPEEIPHLGGRRRRSLAGLRPLRLSIHAEIQCVTDLRRAP